MKHGNGVLNVNNVYSFNECEMWTGLESSYNRAALLRSGLLSGGIVHAVVNDLVHDGDHVLLIASNPPIFPLLSFDKRTLAKFIRRLCAIRSEVYLLII